MVDWLSAAHTLRPAALLLATRSEAAPAATCTRGSSAFCAQNAAAVHDVLQTHPHVVSARVKARVLGRV